MDVPPEFIPTQSSMEANSSDPGDASPMADAPSDRVQHIPNAPDTVGSLASSAFTSTAAPRIALLSPSVFYTPPSSPAIAFSTPPLSSPSGILASHKTLSSHKTSYIAHKPHIDTSHASASSPSPFDRSFSSHLRDFSYPLPSAHVSSSPVSVDRLPVSGLSQNSPSPSGFLPQPIASTSSPRPLTVKRPLFVPASLAHLSIPPPSSTDAPAFLSLDDQRFSTPIANAPPPDFSSLCVACGCVIDGLDGSARCEECSRPSSSSSAAVYDDPEEVELPTAPALLDNDAAQFPGWFPRRARVHGWYSLSESARAVGSPIPGSFVISAGMAFLSRTGIQFSSDVMSAMCSAHGIPYDVESAASLLSIYMQHTCSASCNNGFVLVCPVFAGGSSSSPHTPHVIDVPAIDQSRYQSDVAGKGTAVASERRYCDVDHPDFQADHINESALTALYENYSSSELAPREEGVVFLFGALQKILKLRLSIKAKKNLLFRLCRYHGLRVTAQENLGSLQSKLTAHTECTAGCSKCIFAVLPAKTRDNSLAWEKIRSGKASYLRSHPSGVLSKSGREQLDQIVASAPTRNRIHPVSRGDVDILSLASDVPLKTLQFLYCSPSDGTKHDVNLHAFGRVTIRCRLAQLVSTPNLLLRFTVKELESLCRVHGVKTSGRSPKPELLAKITDHSVCCRCAPYDYHFFTASRPRRIREPTRPPSGRAERSAPAPEVVPLPPPGQQDCDTEYPRVVQPFDPTWRDLYSSFYATTTSAYWKMGPCGCCSQEFRVDDLMYYPVDSIEFSVLSNPNLPDGLLPSGYDHDAFSKAVLQPEALNEDHTEIRLCTTCHRSIVKNQSGQAVDESPDEAADEVGRKKRVPSMPRCALANDLYSAQEHVPYETRKAFQALGGMGRRLCSVARPRCTIFRFDPSRPDSQSYSKGHTIILPQDSITLLKTLPPSNKEIHDSVAVLYVGPNVPDDSVEDQLKKYRPLLVKPNDVREVLTFLRSNNSAYANVDVDDEAIKNMNGEGCRQDEAGVPISLKACTRVVKPSEGVKAATAGYAPDDEGDDHEEAPKEDGHEQVAGYVTVQMPEENSEQVRLKVLRHCRQGGSYVHMNTGTNFIPDRKNPDLLTQMFPHLDPFNLIGIERKRRRNIGMKEHCRALMRQWKSPFARDDSYPYVVQNILQRRAVMTQTMWRVPERNHARVMEGLAQANPATMERLAREWENVRKPQAKNEEERNLLSLINQVSLASRNVPGSPGEKAQMREEIRSLCAAKGTPNWFITINPLDSRSAIVRCLSGEDIDLDDPIRGNTSNWNTWKQRCNSARNPAACARYFNYVIQAYIDCILRPGHPDGGLLGKCSAFYGTVETQGRGTLHCHMLIWISGNPGPRKLRERMAAEQSFRERMFRYVDNLIKQELPGQTEVLVEADGAPAARTKWASKDGVHPTSRGMPDPLLPTQELRDSVDKLLKDLVPQTQFHVHTATCWKHLKRGELRSDATCRMRIDGSTHPETSQDEETGSILHRQLHPRINSYEPLSSLCIRSNMDISFIGSGEHAMALVYYVSEYITKNNLSLHAGVVGLKAARDRVATKHGGSIPSSATVTPEWMTRCINQSMAQVELPASMVHTYLLDLPDHYTSHEFTRLPFGGVLRKYFGYVGQGSSPHDFAQKMRSGQDEHQAPAGSPDVETEGDPIFPAFASDRSYTMDKDGAHEVVPSYVDYRFRPSKYEHFCYYDYVASVYKSKAKDISTVRADKRFLEGHPQAGTHHVSSYKGTKVPVLLGPAIKANYGTEVAMEEFYRQMTVLFGHWRDPADLKPSGSTWKAAFENSNFSDASREIMANMQQMKECKDARDRDADARLPFQLPGVCEDEDVPVVVGEEDPSPVYEAPSSSLDVDATYESVQEAMLSVHPDQQEEVSRLCKAGFFRLLAPQVDGRTATNPGEFVTSEEDAKARSTRDKRFLNSFKGPPVRVASDIPDTMGSSFSGSTRAAATEVRSGAADTDNVFGTLSGDTLRDSYRRVYDDCCGGAKSLNHEQRKAFDLLTHHVMHNESTEQLLMYVGGPGGTGKSRFIDAAVQFLRETGRGDKYSLSAPTGAAASVIDGSTIHSLTGFGGSGKFTSQVEAQYREYWRNTDYLFLDEVSFVSAEFLWFIHQRLARFRPFKELQAFGGVNIIFTGDFSQLPPVRATTVFSHQVTEDLTINTGSSPKGLQALAGAGLWSLINQIVLLHENQRQKADPEYGHMLNMVRDGTGSLEDRSRMYDRLCRRVIGTTDRDDDVEPDRFFDAPIIVSTCAERDAYNLMRVGEHAERAGKPWNLYYTEDVYSGRGLAKSEAQIPLKEKEFLWDTPTLTSDQHMAALPLFIGMKLMITENIVAAHKVVNGAEGILEKIQYHFGPDGQRHIDCLVIRVPGSRIRMPGSSSDETDCVHIYPRPMPLQSKNRDESARRVTRYFVPVLPAYAYTAHKCQGKTLEKAVIDLEGAHMHQLVYVMMSRVKSLSGLAILGPFREKRLSMRPSEELRTEMARLRLQAAETTKFWHRIDLWGSGVPATMQRTPEDAETLRQLLAEGARKRKADAEAEAKKAAKAPPKRRKTKSTAAREADLLDDPSVTTHMDDDDDDMNVD